MPISKIMNPEISELRFPKTNITKYSFKKWINQSTILRNEK
jgi:hypothetical protein